MTEDAELLRQYAENRSEKAFTELVQRNIPLVYSAALRRLNGDSHSAQDVTQTVFSALARNARKLSGRPVITGWLYTTTHFAAAKLNRAQRRRQIREHAANTMQEASSHSKEAVADWTEIRGVIDAAMMDLPTIDREAILLRFFENRRLAEIGRSLHLSEDAARLRVNRALDRLRSLLEKRKVTSTSAAVGMLLANHAVATVPASLASAVTGTALAAHSAVGTSATTFFNLMSSTKITLGIAAVVVVLSLSVTSYETIEARTSKAQARTERAALSRQLQETATRAAALQHEVDTLHVLAETKSRSGGQADRLRAAPVSADEQGVSAQKSSADGDATAPAPFGRHVAMGVPAIVLAKPETRALVLDERRLKAQAQFEPFFSGMKLSTAQREALIAAQVEAENEMMDLAAVYASNVPKESLASINNAKEMAVQIDAEKASRVRAALGEEGYQQFQQFGATLAQRPVTEQLAGRLYASEPLTGPQSDQVARILAENKYAQNAPASPENSLNGTAVTQSEFSTYRTLANQQDIDLMPLITDAAIQRARSVLTPLQVAALRQLQAEQLVRVKLAPAFISNAKGGG